MCLGRARSFMAAVYDASNTVLLPIQVLAFGFFRQPPLWNMKRLMVF